MNLITIGSRIAYTLRIPATAEGKRWARGYKRLYRRKGSPFDNTKSY